MRRVLVALLFLSLPLATFSQSQLSGAPARLPGLLDSAEVIRDTNGIAHIRAANDHDMAFLQGYTHAQDRLFQMDFYRHLGSGTLAELVGMPALAQDVQLRTIGLRRAAARSLDIASPRVKAMLQAYADGVNAYAASHPLPPEYGTLGISQVDPWQPVDSLTIAKLIGFQLYYDLFDIDYTVALATYQQACVAMACDGTKLFFNDLYRSAPFNTATTVPDAMGQSSALAQKTRAATSMRLNPKAVGLAKQYVERIRGLDVFDKIRDRNHAGGSNDWVVSGKLTADGMPLFANDPHLGLSYPPIWYPIHLSAGALDVIGNSFAGTPLVTLGHNRWISWGGTVTYNDFTDYYFEKIVADPNSPSGLSTVYKGNNEPIIPIPQTFYARISGQLVKIDPTPSNGIPAYTLIVPRRNNGPIIKYDPATAPDLAISVQWTGFSGSREMDATLTWAEAKTPADFERGVRLFSTPQNFVYMDRKGNIGYRASGELPLREDLQAGSVAGMPPFLIRNGQGGNEWMTLTHPQPLQALPYEILPFEEMPHIWNPPAGFAVNGNNDEMGVTLENNPLGMLRPGGGIYYLSYQYHFGTRAQRITDLLRAKTMTGKLTFADMQQIQADTLLKDAEFFVPYITQAFNNAKRNGAPVQLALFASDPSVTEAVGRLGGWNFTTPTGLPEGFDGFDVMGQSNPRSAEQIANSVAATIYALWRAQFVNGVIDAKFKPYNLPVPDDPRSMTALRHLLEMFPVNQGKGESGFDFFMAPGITNADDRRDVYILQALKSGLVLLASDKFKNAFGNSTDQNEYRWGKLHRVVFAHPLGSVFNVPPAYGAFPGPFPNLEGLPVDGGLATVDATTHPVRGSDENAFTFNWGPSERAVAQGLKDGVKGVSSLPGGVSGVLGSPMYTNLLPQWLVNGTYDQFFRMNELRPAIESVSKYVP